MLGVGLYECGNLFEELLFHANVLSLHDICHVLMHPIEYNKH